MGVSATHYRDAAAAGEAGILTIAYRLRPRDLRGVGDKQAEDRAPSCPHTRRSYGPDLNVLSGCNLFLHYIPDPGPGSAALAASLLPL